MVIYRETAAPPVITDNTALFLACGKNCFFRHGIGGNIVAAYLTNNGDFPLKQVLFTLFFSAYLGSTIWVS